MKQFLLPLNILPGESLELGGADFHYLCRVRRVKVGDNLSCRTPDGSIYQCELISISPNNLVIKAPLAQGSDLSPVKKFQLHLIQGIPKGKNWI